MSTIDAHYLSIYGRPLGGGARKYPNGTVKKEILAAQGGNCLYCGLQIGGLVKRRGKIVATRVAWDHFIPYSFLSANPRANWVAACNICNQIKSSKIFETVRDAQISIKTRWIELGYEPVSAI